MSNIYNKKHLIIVQSNKDKRKLNIKVEIETTSSNVSSKEFFIRLTDADSLSFLFCLKINDENFQELKHQQGLLVDLCAFGQKLIDLLELCKSEESSDSPRYILKMCGNGELNSISSMGDNWTLNFIETNPFKHLTHLSLRFCHGDVDSFKNYLIDCLKNCRMKNCNLTEQLSSTENSLSKKLKDTEISLNNTQEQLHNLQITSKIQLEEIRTNLENQIEKSKDKLIETESYYKSKHDQERRDLENNFTIATRNYEAKIQNLETTNKCLCDENSKLESDLRESKLRYDNLDECYKRANQEVQNLRRNKEQSDKSNHELECQMQKMNTKIAVLEQEVRDKDQILHRTQDLYTSEQDVKNRYMDESQKKSRQIEKFEKAVKNLNDEVAKGNEIIYKLQTDIKHCHSKIKLRTQITAEQEKVLGDRESELKRLTLEIENLKKEVFSKEDDAQKANLNLEQTTKKLEEANHVIKTNENVINWLNRQVTEHELSKQKPGFIGLPPPKSQAGTAFTSSTDTTIKYRPMSASSNLSNGDHSNNSVLAGIVNRGKLLPSSNTSTTVPSQSQGSYNTQLLLTSKFDPSKNFSSLPFSMSSEKLPNSSEIDSLDPKYLIKSSAVTASNSRNKFGQTQNQPTRNPISGVLSIPEETEAPNSPHQQSLSSAYFPKPLLGPR